LRVDFSVRSSREIDRVEHCYLEQGPITQLLEIVRDGDVIFDVGANIGVISLILAKAKPGVTVHAFEPVPVNHASLCRNITLNSLGDRVVPRRMAISSSEGTVRIFAEQEPGAGRSSMVLSPGNGSSAIEVECASVDCLASNLGRDPTVVKIDVEGAEWEVVRGMTETAARGVLRAILVEIHPIVIAGRGLEVDRVLEPLFQAGFTERWSSRRGSELHVLLTRGPTI
jgi:FkbM family methyltransferase